MKTTNSITEISYNVRIMRGGNEFIKYQSQTDEKMLSSGLRNDDDCRTGVCCTQSFGVWLGRFPVSSHHVPPSHIYKLEKWFYYYILTQVMLTFYKLLDPRSPPALHGGCREYTPPRERTRGKWLLRTLMQGIGNKFPLSFLCRSMNNYTITILRIRNECPL